MHIMSLVITSLAGGDIYKLAFTLTHTHTHTLVLTHTRTHIHTHTHKHTHKHTQTHTNTHTLTLWTKAISRNQMCTSCTCIKVVFNIYTT